jgi:hypothetical protein
MHTGRASSRIALAIVFVCCVGVYYVQALAGV